MFLSAEFHPFRLPSPGLWLDIFQKVKAMGFSGVSFYHMWALLEGEPGHVRIDGVFALEEFFAAAKEAGIYLLARPGPYINSETTGGGFPGWLQKTKSQLRSTNPEFLNAIKPYILEVGKIVAKAEITKGGPVILLQPDNEYTLCSESTGILDMSNCLDKQYMAFVEETYREAGVTVPILVNDALPLGNFAPGTGVGSGDIYGWDFYPFGWGQPPCSNPQNWTRSSLPYPAYLSLLRNISLPTSPRSIVEFQGGAPDAWGGVGVEQCASLVNQDFERVFYKSSYSLHVTLFNIYMTYGGTNWGNIGHPLGYTSYDAGAAISEDRQLTREKYAELKLQGNFHRASPAYLTAQPNEDSKGIYTDSSVLLTTPLLGSKTNFYVVRHDDYQSTNLTRYSLRLSTKIGNITIPQLGGSLLLAGRDSKIHVTNFDIGGIDLLYSSAEIFTWKRTGNKSTLLLYGGMGETHEFALPKEIGVLTDPENENIKYSNAGKAQIVQWTVGKDRVMLSFGKDLDIYLLWRNEVYTYWTLDLPSPEPLGRYTSPSRLNSSDASRSSVIVKAGYLLRSASIRNERLYLVGDVNATTEIEVITAPLGCCKALSFNGRDMESTFIDGRLTATVLFEAPEIHLPDLAKMDWRYVDSLPEIQNGFDDNSWTLCDKVASNNPRVLTTPTSLYASDYGYHAGSFIYRGHFMANGNETALYLQTQGGFAFGHGVWLNSSFLGSWPGTPEASATNHTLMFPRPLVRGSRYVLTVLIDHMGYDENYYNDINPMKAPRGILEYSLSGHSDASSITWKMTGNLGGETYRDHSRGPLNEGAMFAERQGYHLPGAPTASWEERSPLQGINSASVGFFVTTFTLDIPAGYDIPLAIELHGPMSVAGVKDKSSNFRVQIFVNGWQFGKYVNNLGPQMKFFVPEGILDYNGDNYLGLTLWSLDGMGAKLEDVKLSYDVVVQSGYSKPKVVQAIEYEKRV
ncbi:glycoside hydrolase family 35 protein [Aulographum hederae CBS 113979]|uniref:beta-galactosidase n=1 Tax=Aulographum hederae CBS 113979 TaxID=1176131 RepID=A0A6G1GYS6_9PEZI|nr:glycoside hydrolase family 35 protein [Aulographum hederae CBS 113979]